MRILSQSRTFGRVQISTNTRRAGSINLGELPRGPRVRSRVIEMQNRQPGEAGAQLRRITRPLESTKQGPDVDYED